MNNKMEENTILEYEEYQKLKKNKDWKAHDGLKVKLKNGAVGEYSFNHKNQLVFRIKKGVKNMEKIRTKAIEVKKERAALKKNQVVEKLRKIYYDTPNEPKYTW